jgi:hypothetical protein
LDGIYIAPPGLKRCIAAPTLPARSFLFLAFVSEVFHGNQHMLGLFHRKSTHACKYNMKERIPLVLAQAVPRHDDGMIVVNETSCYVIVM